MSSLRSACFVVVVAIVSVVLQGCGENTPETPTSTATTPEPETRKACVHPLKIRYPDYEQAGKCGPSIGRCNPLLGRTYHPRQRSRDPSDLKWCNLASGTCGTWDSVNRSGNATRNDEYDFEPTSCIPDNEFPKACAHPLSTEADKCGPSFGRCNRFGFCRLGYCGSWDVLATRGSERLAHLRTDEYDFEPVSCAANNALPGSRRLLRGY